MKKILLAIVFIGLGAAFSFYAAVNCWGPDCQSRAKFNPSSPKSVQSENGFKVGILHSLTGTMAFSEKPVVDAALLAIDEINRGGGVLGRKVVPIVVDGRSDGPTFLQAAERLIKGEGVSVVFGCWTSACRKSVKPVFEKENHLLFYPVQYEGIEQSPNIIYTGAAPNQQIIPAVKWCLDHLGQKFFLVGSDYVFPRTANLIIKNLIDSLGGKILGEEYLPLGSGEVTEIVQKIIAARPAVILNTINGDSNRAFFQELRRMGVTPQKIPVVSFSIAEHEYRKMAFSSMAGDYAAWSYFQGIQSPENTRFVNKFKAMYGKDRVVDDPMEAEYFGIHLWAQAVREAGSAQPRAVRNTIKGQSLIAPEGFVYVDPVTLHTWRSSHIGKTRKDGFFDIVWSSEEPIRPVPYPIYQSRSEWENFLKNLYLGWGNRWASS
ncbi:MAG: urea ABC transporter substrate-binding protein [Nitrospinaceae bacterium]